MGVCFRVRHVVTLLLVVLQFKCGSWLCGLFSLLVVVLERSDGNFDHHEITLRPSFCLSGLRTAVIFVTKLGTVAHDCELEYLV